MYKPHLEGDLAAIVVVTATVYGLSAVDTGPFQTGARKNRGPETCASDKYHDGVTGARQRDGVLQRRHTDTQR